ncbi:hypothetical protein CYD53_1072 [Bosea psychrotolerans]|uniref:Uncharacterized protein n=1 Tax=Bosea psychrotolerans TaxID=1871628 RepID=A0A2S4M989_9HYPH|nr:hypothetical protein CYD53_1072 [Bosea psychrotolerans]
MSLSLILWFAFSVICDVEGTPHIARPEIIW